MSKKLGLFLYLFVGHYKCIDIIMHRKLQVIFKSWSKYIGSIYVLFTSAIALMRASLQANRSFIASSVSSDDAVKRDSSALDHEVCKHRHAIHASILFWWLVNWHKPLSNWRSHFCTRKNDYYSKDSNKISFNREQIKKTFNLSEVNSGTGFFGL